MNKIIFMICLLLIHELCASQTTSSLVGKWKVFCLWDDEIYFNLKTDSFSVSDEMKMTYPEPERQKLLVQAHVNAWRNLQYHFGNDGMYRMFFNDTLPMDGGKYRENKKDSIIEYDFVGGDGIIRTGKISYWIKDQSLYLKMHWADLPVGLILDRMK